MRLGDPQDRGGILWNRIEALIDGGGLKHSTGTLIYGRGNRLNLTFLQIAEKSGVIFEAGADENLVESQNLLGRYTDRAATGSNFIRGQERDALAVKTPAFPRSDDWVENPYPTTVEVTILTPAAVSVWERREVRRAALAFKGGLHAGQTFTLCLHESVRFDYAGVAASWDWRALRR
jgi:hypothetical protein